MKHLLTIILFLCLLLQGFTKALILVDYELRKDFIAKNICENRDKPQMHCNGKCHLRKQLKKDEEKNSQESNKQLDKSDVILFFQPTSPKELYTAFEFGVVQKFPVISES